MHALQDALRGTGETAARREGAQARLAPVRVCYFDHTARLSGGEIALFHLVTSLDRAAVQPVVLLGEEGRLRDRFRDAGIETHVLPLSPSLRETRKESLGIASLLRLGDCGRAAAYVLRLVSFLRRERIAILHTNSLKADLLGGIAGRLAGIPVVWHVRDRIESDYLPPAAVRGFRLLCRAVPQFVIANSQATLATLALPHAKESAAIYSGVPCDESRETRRQCVVLDGIPAETYAAPPETEIQPPLGEIQPPLGEIQPPLGEIQPPLGATSPPVIGMVGRLAPWKGQHVFLQAAEIVHRMRPDVRFVVVGDALFGEEAYRARLHRFCVERDLCGSVDFLGFRPDVPELLSEMTMLVHASVTPEPFGQVVVEGMAAGKPIIATEGGGINEIVENGVTGRLVRRNDGRQMAAAILSLLNAPGEARAMGARGSERVRRYFTIERASREVERVYRQMRP